MIIRESCPGDLRGIIGSYLSGRVNPSTTQRSPTSCPLYTMRIGRSALSGGRHARILNVPGGLRCKDFKKVSRWRISRQTEARRSRPGGSCLRAPRGVFRHCSCPSVLVPIALNEHQNSLRTLTRARKPSKNRQHAHLLRGAGAWLHPERWMSNFVREFSRSITVVR